MIARLFRYTKIVVIPKNLFILILVSFLGAGCSVITDSVSEMRYKHDVVPAAEFVVAPVDAEMLESLKELSQVTKNRVFVEEDGVSEYIIGPDDILELTSWAGTKPEKYLATVRPDGTVSFSFLDDIKVGDLTPRQVDTLLTEKLSRYIKNVRIDVVVSKYESKSALLFGEINILQTGKSGPGKYILKGKTTVLDLIVDAGGDTKDSDLKNVELVRDGQRYPLNLYKVMFKGDVSQNVIIDDGDVVTVPELPTLGERVYVFGEVQREGIYAQENTPDLLAAIGQAGGTTPVAVDGAVKIIRGYGEGRKPVVLSASLDDILKRGDISQNVPLINGDVVYVPRTVIGDVNEFILNTTPLLEYLLYPDEYDEAYSLSGF